MKAKIVCAWLLAFGLFGGKVSAAPILFNVSIDTSAASGQTVDLAYQGLSIDAVGDNATGTVSNISGVTFVGDTTLAGAGVTGSAADGLFFDGAGFEGTLRATQAAVLTNLLEFNVLFEGASVDSPIGAYGVFDVALRIDGSNDIGGFLFALRLLGTGEAAPLFASDIVTITQLENTVPNPGILALMLIGLFGMKRCLPKRQKLVPVVA